jgi:RNA polymerase sigma factor (sigma-70 family)
VLGAILNGVRRLDPVSERVRRTIRIAERIRYALAQELHALPAPHALDERVPGLARAQIEAHRGTPLSLDAVLPAGERLEPDAAGDPQTIVVRRAERERVRAAVAALPVRQRQIVEAHYFEERSLRSLHGALAVSPQRVSQLHLLAVARLRAELDASA